MNPFAQFLNQQFTPPPPQPPPPPTNPFAKFLAQILATKAGVVNKAHDFVKEAGRPSREAWANFFQPDGRVNPEAAKELAFDIGGVTGTLNPVAKALKPFGETLFSRLANSIDNAPFQKGTGAQWLAQTGKNVPQGERTWAGLDEIFSANPNRVFTKEEVSRIAQEMGPRLNVVDPRQIRPSFTTYDSYVQPGPRDKVIQNVFQLQDGPDIRALRGVMDDYRMDEINEKFVKATNAMNELKTRQYTGGHYSEEVPNDVAHYRATVRSNTPWGKALGVEEIQSDAHQAARAFVQDDPGLGRVGYTKPDEFRKAKADYSGTQKAWQKFANELSDARERLVNLVEDRGIYNYDELFDNPEKYKQLYEEAGVPQAEKAYADNEALHMSASRRMEAARDGIPDLPFKKTDDWVELGLKKAIYDAVNEGADNILFPSPRGVHSSVNMPLDAAQAFYGFDPAKPGMVQKTLQNYLKSQGIKDALPEAIPEFNMADVMKAYEGMSSAQQREVLKHINNEFFEVSNRPQVVSDRIVRDVISMMRGKGPEQIEQIAKAYPVIADALKLATQGFSWRLPVTPSLKELAKSQRMWSLMGLPAAMSAMQNNPFVAPPVVPDSTKKK